LSIHIKVTPDADHLFALDGEVDNFYSFFNSRKWRLGKPIGVEKGLGGVGGVDPASDESLRDERMQAQG